MDKKKAFVSYSHEDRDFVERLANALNNQGVPLFFDKWDIQPGDSLVQKIFGEGLADSAFFFVVLSQASTRSKWMREELDVATVQRIEGFTRIIPILKEDCDIPLSLRALRWIDLRKDFDAGVRELANLVHGVNERPPLGAVPDHVQGMAQSVGGLSREASTIGLLMLEKTDIDTGSIPQLQGGEIQRETQLEPLEISDAVDELEVNGLIKTVKWLGTAPFNFGVALPTYALFLEFKDFLSYDPEEDVRIVLNAVAALQKCTNQELHEQTKLSVGRLNRAVEYVQDYGLAQVLKTMGSAPYTFTAIWATAQTRRFVKSAK